jgi:uncharacterized membrane protein YeaQ/YmgE (transglycosylase-associated protein family)
MTRTKLIWLLMGVGGFVGGWIPTLWGSDPFSFASILGTAIGGFVGIWAGFRLGE